MMCNSLYVLIIIQTFLFVMQIKQIEFTGEILQYCQGLLQIFFVITYHNVNKMYIGNVRNVNITTTEHATRRATLYREGKHQLPKFSHDYKDSWINENREKNLTDWHRSDSGGEVPRQRQRQSDLRECGRNFHGTGASIDWQVINSWTFDTCASQYEIADFIGELLTFYIVKCVPQPGIEFLVELRRLEFSRSENVWYFEYGIPCYEASCTCRIIFSWVGDILVRRNGNIRDSSSTDLVLATSVYVFVKLSSCSWFRHFPRTTFVDNVRVAGPRNTLWVVVFSVGSLESHYNWYVCGGVGFHWERLCKIV